jgi:hypothetical protein
MRWTRNTIAAAVFGGALILGSGAAAAGILVASSHSAVIAVAPAAHAAPAKTTPAPVPTKTVTVPPAAPAQAPASAAQPGITIINNPPAAGSTVYVPVPEYNVPAYVTTNETVVQQYYQFLNNQDFQDAWDLGGSNVSGGVGYDAWVAGYSGTARISLSTWAYDPNSNAVEVTITALQDGGTTNVYQGTYTVENDVIVGANIVQTS